MSFLFFSVGMAVTCDGSSNEIGSPVIIAFIIVIALLLAGLFAAIVVIVVLLKKNVKLQ